VRKLSNLKQNTANATNIERNLVLCWWHSLISSSSMIGYLNQA